MTDNPWSNHLDAALRAANHASTAIQEIYDNWDGSGQTDKSDGSPLTRADLASDNVIRATLAAAFPDIPYLSEESGETPYAVRSAWPLYWLVDPLDGTKEFISRNGEFTVNIALIQGGEPVMGVVAVPVSGDIFLASKGAGARQYGVPVSGRLSAASFSRKDAGLRLVASRSHRDAATEEFMGRFTDPVIRPAGSSLKFMLIARADADVYPRFAPTMEWDTAAAQIIVEEAGGQVLETSSGKPLRYNKPELLNPFFIAWGNCSDIPKS